MSLKVPIQKGNIEDLKDLFTTVKTLVIFSSECERSFSSKNEIVSPKRNLLSDHVSSLIFINCVEPPIEQISTTQWI